MAFGRRKRDQETGVAETGVDETGVDETGADETGAAQVEETVTAADWDGAEVDGPFDIEDFDTPEQRLGFFQDWRPWESCICLTNSWSYSGGEPKSRDQLIQMLVANACSPGNRSGTACSRASAETFFRVSSFEL